MPELKELMGHEAYDLIYTYYDHSGALMEDMDQVFYCDAGDIPQSRIPKLEALLTPITDAGSSLVPVEAAKLLAAWGVESAVDYFEYCVDERIDRLGNLDPHRLHGYDTTYERIAHSILHYYDRCCDKSAMDGEKARCRIFHLLGKIIFLSQELTIDMSFLIKEIQDEGWVEYLPVIKACYIDFMGRPERDFNRQWNLSALQEVLEKWDPDFIL